MKKKLIKKKVVKKKKSATVSKAANNSIKQKPVSKRNKKKLKPVKELTEQELGSMVKLKPQYYVYGENIRTNNIANKKCDEFYYPVTSVKEVILRGLDFDESKDEIIALIQKKWGYSYRFVAEIYNELFEKFNNKIKRKELKSIKYQHNSFVRAHLPYELDC